MQQEWNVILQDPVLEWFKTLKQEDLSNRAVKPRPLGRGYKAQI
ncbi:hypothetical protein [Histophilus somni]|nr:hypothetical protein [Histophilus somni]